MYVVTFLLQFSKSKVSEMSRFGNFLWLLFIYFLIYFVSLCDSVFFRSLSTRSIHLFFIMAFSLAAEAVLRVMDLKIIALLYCFSFLSREKKIFNDVYVVILHFTLY